MDTAGATLGPLIVLALGWWFFGQQFLNTPSREHADVYRLVFIAAAVPAIIGWVVLQAFVQEQRRDHAPAEKPQLSLRAFDPRFKVFLLVLTLFGIGNSSDAFLVLPIGMSLFSFLLVYVAFNAFSTFVALRSGIVSDRVGRKPVILVGWLVFAASYLGMAMSRTMTEGMLKAFAVDLAPPHLRGTAVGAFYTIHGLAAFPASLIAGFLWTRVSHSAPFFYGALTSAAAALLLAALVKPAASPSS